MTLDIGDQKVLLIDTPGVSFVNDEDDEPTVIEQRRARDILLRSKGRIDRLKDPNPPGMVSSYVSTGLGRLIHIFS